MAAVATQKEVEQALLDAIQQHTSLSTTSNAAAFVDAHTNAARALAEALAWVKFPAQPH